MKIALELSDILLKEYALNKFEETLERVLADIKNGSMCGNYERETIELLRDGFKDSYIISP